MLLKELKPQWKSVPTMITSKLDSFCKCVEVLMTHRRKPPDGCMNDAVDNINVNTKQHLAAGGIPNWQSTERERECVETIMIYWLEIMTGW